MEVSLLGDSQMVRVRRTWRTQRPAGDEADYDCTGSGWTTKDLLSAVRVSGNKLRPVCVVLIGINDITKCIPMNSTKKSISSLITFLTRSKKRILIATLPPTLHTRSSSIHQATRQLNIYIQSFNTHPSTSVIYFHKHFFPFSSVNPKLFEQRYTDGRPDLIHLSAVGHSLLIRLISNALAVSSLPRPPTSPPPPRPHVTAVTPQL